ncbi:MAG: PEP-CTERM sorting domain-containing protein [Acidobacteriia bacterium]|nr:PEP-CTERM sorting domain-containing protein [Terriglobia bacterium]
MGKLASGLFCLVLLLAVGTAQATTISFTTVVGNYGASTATIGGIGVAGFYFDTSGGGSWKAANLFGRNESTDRGVGVCDPVEASQHLCGTGSGNGDWNELSNELAKELIRLTLPAGYHWVSVQLSSLDGNGSTHSADWERGQLLSSSSGSPSGPTSVICNFAANNAFSCSGVSVGGTSVEPILGVPVGSANSPYLFFKPWDWTTGHHNTNNDFLVLAATIEKNNQVPEPATMLLLVSGIPALIARRKLRA